MSAYETDGYQRIMDWIAAESGVAYGDSPEAKKAHRILADHGRSMTFLVGDGVTPSNEGRGYVLRRIIRRAIVQARRIGLRDVYPVTGIVAEQMRDAYPELRERATEIEATVRAEEERFRETLERGLKVFEELAGATRSPAKMCSRWRRRTGSRSSSRSSSRASAVSPSTSTDTRRRWRSTGTSRAARSRPTCNAPPSSRAAHPSRPSSSATARPRC